MSVPLFPNLKPRLMHSSWFCVDQPCDDEEEVSQLEREHQNWIAGIKQMNSDLTPIGKTASETMEEDEEDDDEDDNDDDEESETHDEEEEDEMEMDVSQERSSPLMSALDLSRVMVYDKLIYLIGKNSSSCTYIV